METRTRRWLGRRRDEERALTRESLPSVMLPDLASPDAPSARRSMALADVFACVRVLCDGAIMAPLQLYRHAAAGRERVEDGETVELLREPMPGVSQPSFVAQLVACLSLWGEAFVGKLRAVDGSLAQLSVLPPDLIEVEIVGGEPRFKYRHPSGRIFERLTRDDVIHVRGVTLDGVRGASPVNLCREAVGLAASLDTAASAFWANGAVPGGVLTVPPGSGADGQAQALADGWSKRHQGPKQRGRIAVVTGEINWQAVSMPLTDAEFIATAHLSTAQIARIFRVPPSMVNAPTNASMTYSNIESEGAAFVRYSLGPWLRLIEEAVSLDADLCPPRHYWRFNLDALQRADTQTRFGVYETAIRSGVMTANECRALEDLAPREEPDGPTDDG